METSSGIHPISSATREAGTTRLDACMSHALMSHLQLMLSITTVSSKIGRQCVNLLFLVSITVAQFLGPSNPRDSVHAKRAQRRQDRITFGLQIKYNI